MLTTTKQPKIKYIPEIRFGGFVDDWKEKDLEDVVSFLMGKGISKNDIDENGSNKCIRYGELYTEYGEVINKVISRTNVSKEESLLSVKGDTMIPSSGETAIDIARVSCIKEDDVLLGGGLTVMRPKKEMDGRFLAYYLSNYKKHNIARLSQGHSVAHLYSTHLRGLSVNVPSLEEQNKIGEFLETIDLWHENLLIQKADLECYKKGVVQKIFSKEIRFSGDDGNDFPEWEIKELNELLDYEQPTSYIVESTEYSDKYQTPVLTAGKTFILGYTNETKGIFNSTNLPVILFDDFTTASKFVDFPFKVKSSAAKILRAKNSISVRFVYEAMQLIQYEISGHGRHWISKYSKLKISVPSLPEQKKIEEYLASIDNLIKSMQAQIEEAREWKKGLMQKLFI